MKNLDLRRVFALIFTLLLAASLIAGCDQKPKTSDTADEPPLGEPVDLDKLPKVEVPEDGIKFDPSIPVAQLPDGAWTCDMGDLSHYAAMDKKDGKCPVCHMDLLQVKDGKIQE